MKFTIIWSRWCVSMFLFTTCMPLPPTYWVHVAWWVCLKRTCELFLPFRRQSRAQFWRNVKGGQYFGNVMINNCAESATTNELCFCLFHIYLMEHFQWGFHCGTIIWCLRSASQEYRLDCGMSVGVRPFGIDKSGLIFFAVLTHGLIAFRSLVS